MQMFSSVCFQAKLALQIAAQLEMDERLQKKGLLQGKDAAGKEPSGAPSGTSGKSLLLFQIA